MALAGLTFLACVLSTQAFPTLGSLGHGVGLTSDILAVLGGGHGISFDVLSNALLSAFGSGGNDGASELVAKTFVNSVENCDCKKSYITDDFVAAFKSALAAKKAKDGLALKTCIEAFKSAARTCNVKDATLPTNFLTTFKSALGSKKSALPGGFFDIFNKSLNAGGTLGGISGGSGISVDVFLKAIFSVFGAKEKITHDIFQNCPFIWKMKAFLFLPTCKKAFDKSKQRWLFSRHSDQRRITHDIFHKCLDSFGKCKGLPDNFIPTCKKAFDKCKGNDGTASLDSFIPAFKNECGWKSVPLPCLKAIQSPDNQGAFPNGFCDKLKGLIPGFGDIKGLGDKTLPNSNLGDSGISVDVFLKAIFSAFGAKERITHDIFQKCLDSFGKCKGLPDNFIPTCKKAFDKCKGNDGTASLDSFIPAFKNECGWKSVPLPCLKAIQSPDNQGAFPNGFCDKLKGLIPGFGDIKGLGDKTLPNSNLGDSGISVDVFLKAIFSAFGAKERITHDIFHKCLDSFGKCKGLPDNFIPTCKKAFDKCKGNDGTASLDSFIPAFKNECGWKSVPLPCLKAIQSPDNQGAFPNGFCDKLKGLIPGFGDIKGLGDKTLPNSNLGDSGISVDVFLKAIFSVFGAKERITHDIFQKCLDSFGKCKGLPDNFIPTCKKAFDKCKGNDGTASLDSFIPAFKNECGWKSVPLPCLKAIQSPDNQGAFPNGFCDKLKGLIPGFGDIKGLGDKTLPNSNLGDSGISVDVFLKAIFSVFGAKERITHDIFQKCLDSFGKCKGLPDNFIPTCKKAFDKCKGNDGTASLDSFIPAFKNECGWKSVPLPCLKAIQSPDNQGAFPNGFCDKLKGLIPGFGDIKGLGDKTLPNSNLGDSGISVDVFLKAIFSVFGAKERITHDIFQKCLDSFGKCKGLPDNFIPTCKKAFDKCKGNDGTASLDSFIPAFKNECGWKSVPLPCLKAIQSPDNQGAFPNGFCDKLKGLIPGFGDIKGLGDKTLPNSNLGDSGISVDVFLKAIFSVFGAKEKITHDIFQKCLDSFGKCKGLPDNFIPTCKKAFDRCKGNDGTASLDSFIPAFKNECGWKSVPLPCLKAIQSPDNQGAFPNGFCDKLKGLIPGFGDIKGLGDKTLPNSNLGDSEISVDVFLKAIFSVFGAKEKITHDIFQKCLDSFGKCKGLPDNFIPTCKKAFDRCKGNDGTASLDSFIPAFKNECGWKSVPLPCLKAIQSPDNQGAFPNGFCDKLKGLIPGFGDIKGLGDKTLPNSNLGDSGISVDVFLKAIFSVFGAKERITHDIFQKCLDSFGKCKGLPDNFIPTCKKAFDKCKGNDGTASLDSFIPAFKNECGWKSVPLPCLKAIQSPDNQGAFPNGFCDKLKGLIPGFGDIKGLGDKTLPNLNLGDSGISVDVFLKAIFSVFGAKEKITHDIFQKCLDSFGKCKGLPDNFIPTCKKAFDRCKGNDGTASLDSFIPAFKNECGWKSVPLPCLKAIQSPDNQGAFPNGFCDKLKGLIPGFGDIKGLGDKTLPNSNLGDSEISVDVFLKAIFSVFGAKEKITHDIFQKCLDSFGKCKGLPDNFIPTCKKAFDRCKGNDGTASLDSFIPAFKNECGWKSVPLPCLKAIQSPDNQGAFPNGFCDKLKGLIPGFGDIKGLGDKTLPNSNLGDSGISVDVFLKAIFSVFGAKERITHDIFQKCLDSFGKCKGLPDNFIPTCKKAFDKCKGNDGTAWLNSFIPAFKDESGWKSVPLPCLKAIKSPENRLVFPSGFSDKLKDFGPGFDNVSPQSPNAPKDADITNTTFTSEDSALTPNSNSQDSKTISTKEPGGENTAHTDTTVSVPGGDGFAQPGTTVAPRTDNGKTGTNETIVTGNTSTTATTEAPTTSSDNSSDQTSALPPQDAPVKAEDLADGDANDSDRDGTNGSSGNTNSTNGVADGANDATGEVTSKDGGKISADIKAGGSATKDSTGTESKNSNLLGLNLGH
ncbi:unnamed protein product [Leptosia nina]|uniref:Uncharacterized protein n=1 Tax=Leptosia nina TaxID=320188 RepID=A0AAV1K0W1_9NEOP